MWIVVWGILRRRKFAIHEVAATKRKSAHGSWDATDSTLHNKLSRDDGQGCYGINARTFSPSSNLEYWDSEGGCHCTTSRLL